MIHHPNTRRVLTDRDNGFDNQFNPVSSIIFRLLQFFALKSTAHNATMSPSKLALVIAIFYTPLCLAFTCPKPVVPSTSPSNACCESLSLIPGTDPLNPAGGDVYYGTNCNPDYIQLSSLRMKAVLTTLTGEPAKKRTAIDDTQEESYPCGGGFKEACCDPVSSSRGQ